MFESPKPGGISSTVVRMRIAESIGHMAHTREIEDHRDLFYEAVSEAAEGLHLDWTRGGQFCLMYLK